MALMWGFYLYLIRGPLALLLLLVFGIDLGFGTATSGAANAPTRGSLAQTLFSYALVAADNAGILIAWSLYNLARFRDINRRQFARVVTPQHLAELYTLPVGDVEAWQDARLVVIHHDDHGNVLSTAARQHARRRAHDRRSPASQAARAARARPGMVPRQPTSRRREVAHPPPGP